MFLIAWRGLRTRPAFAFGRVAEVDATSSSGTGDDTRLEGIRDTISWIWVVAAGRVRRKQLPLQNEKASISARRLLPPKLRHPIWRIFFVYDSSPTTSFLPASYSKEPCLLTTPTLPVSFARSSQVRHFKSLAARVGPELNRPVLIDYRYYS